MTKLDQQRYIKKLKINLDGFRKKWSEKEFKRAFLGTIIILRV